MSYKNLKLTVWSKKDGEVRIYIGTGFVDFRHGMGEADGCCIREDENGQARFGYKPAYNAEGRAIALAEVAYYLTGERRRFDVMVGIAFNELLSRVEACKTKGGNFSYVQYEKKFG